MQSGGAFVILFCLIFIFCSVLLMKGVQKEFRGLFIPWMICMTLVILFQAVYGLWIVIGYYIVSRKIFTLPHYSYYSYYFAALECIRSNLQLDMDGC